MIRSYAFSLCLVLALCLAVAQAFFGLAGPLTGRRAWMAVARPAAAGQFVFIAIAFAVGCGGESTSGTKTTTPSGDVARTAGGEAITTADGNAVTKKAHSKWESALAEFDKNEKAGWTPAACSASSKSFERAADAQSGGFAEAHYMAGLALSRCGDEGAYKHYEQALKIDSKLCKARVGLGLRDLEGGRRYGTLQDFEPIQYCSAVICPDNRIDAAIVIDTMTAAGFVLDNSLLIVAGALVGPVRLLLGHLLVGLGGVGGLGVVRGLGDALRGLAGRAALRRDTGEEQLGT